MTTTFSAGQKVRASQLSQGTVIARAQRLTSGTATTATTAATAQKLCELDVSLIAGRLYRICVVDFGIFSTAAANAQLQITYTTDGSTPSVTSTILTTGQVTTPAGSIVISGSLSGLYSPGSNLTFKALVSYWCNTGATTVNIFANTSWPFDLVVEDLGVDPGVSGTQF
jgi:hypothetical protein